MSTFLVAQVPRIRVGGGITPPMKTVHVDPAYPADAKARGIQGTILEAEVTKSIEELDAAALTAVRQWNYTPTLLNGEPVELIMTVTVNLQLPQQPQ